MDNDVSQRLVHLLANLKDVPHSDFATIRSYLQSTEYEVSFGPLYDAVQSFYDTRHQQFPDLAWLTRQFPSVFNTYNPIAWHADDLYVLQSILRDESYRNKVLSATWGKDLDKAGSLLTEYKQVSANLVAAPTTAKEVFVNFDSERELLGTGILTSFSPVDADIDFLPYKGLVVLAAPTKSFKTMTASNIVYDAVINQGKNVVYLTLEDQYKSIWSNLLSKHSYVTGLPTN